MALGTAAEELAKITKRETYKKDLNDRFEVDYGYFRGKKFAIPTSEGKWESFTSNRAPREANKMINALAASWLKLSIPLTKENEQERKNLSATERFPYGAISLRDSLMTGVPEALPLQAALSWHATVRGWIGLLVYLREGDDGKNGKVIPHIAVWDIFNSCWITGERGLLWVSSKRYASPEDVKETYKEEMKPDTTGRVILYDVWDREQHGVIGGEGDSGGYLLNPEDHGLKHVPALILPGGSTPFIQSAEYTDTIKDVGPSFAVNNRELYNVESRIGSYMQTLAGRTAKTPMQHKWDSTKSGGIFPALEGNPFEKGSEVPIDVGKGEELDALPPPELTNGVFAFFEYLRDSLDLGGQSPLPPTAGPAAGLNIKRHEAMEKMMVARILMERTYEWFAHEVVSQYKTGKFGKMEIQGVDGRNQKFKMDVSPEDIDDSWQFKAELISDFPQDQMANVGMGVQLKQGELLSLETIQDQYLHVADTDLEQQKMAREKAYNTFFIEARHLAAVLFDQGDVDGAKFIVDDIERMKMEREQSAGVAPQAGVPSPVRPSADTSAVTPNPGKIQNFLGRLGGR